MMKDADAEREIARRRDAAISRALNTAPTSMRAAEEDRKAKKAAKKSVPTKPKSS